MLGLVQDHRMLRVRQATGSEGNSGSSTGTGATSPSPSSSSSATATSSGTSETTTSATTSQTSTSQTTSATTSQTTSSSSSSSSATSATSAETTSTAATTASTTSASTSATTSASTSATASATSNTNTSTSSSTTSSATTTSATSSNTHVETTAAADPSSTGSYTTFTYTQTSSYRTITRIGTSQLPGSTVSAEASGSSSSSLNTIAFVLRRKRNRRRADEFEASQFRRSAVVLDEDTLAPHRPTATAPQMYERGHSVAPSITSTTSPGMAGQGAYYAAQADADQYEPYGAHPYASTPYATTNAPPVVQDPPQPTHVLQPRPQYTFGQVPATSGQNVMSDDGHENMQGAYSSEPTPQASYNQEAYSNYHAYSPDSAAYGNSAGAHARTRTNDDDAYGGI
ncbi:hypothetical protein IW262DRAFT_251977 [Armillaria fumosa]|nr:hypothetical protein IW262DRAFT_251977 [Armillaria fumosa]